MITSIIGRAFLFLGIVLTALQFAHRTYQNPMPVMYGGIFDGNTQSSFPTRVQVGNYTYEFEGHIKCRAGNGSYLNPLATRQELSHCLTEANTGDITPYCKPVTLAEVDKHYRTWEGLALAALCIFSVLLACMVWHDVAAFGSNVRTGVVTSCRLCFDSCKNEVVADDKVSDEEGQTDLDFLLKLDMNNDGDISADEIQTCFANVLNVYISEDQAQDVLKNLDVDDNHMINFQEFKKKIPRRKKTIGNQTWARSRHYAFHCVLCLASTLSILFLVFVFMFIEMSAVPHIFIAPLSLGPSRDKENPIPCDCGRLVGISTLTGSAFCFTLFVVVNAIVGHVLATVKNSSKNNPLMFLMKSQFPIQAAAFGVGANKLHRKIRQGPVIPVLKRGNLDPIEFNPGRSVECCCGKTQFHELIGSLRIYWTLRAIMYAVAIWSIQCFIFQQLSRDSSMYHQRLAVEIAFTTVAWIGSFIGNALLQLIGQDWISSSFTSGVFFLSFFACARVPVVIASKSGDDKLSEWLLGFWIVLGFFLFVSTVYTTCCWKHYNKQVEKRCPGFFKYTLYVWEKDSFIACILFLLLCGCTYKLPSFCLDMHCKNRPSKCPDNVPDRSKRDSVGGYSGCDSKSEELVSFAEETSPSVASGMWSPTQSHVDVAGDTANEAIDEFSEACVTELAGATAAKVDDDQESPLQQHQEYL